ncbi:hypothetical protein GLOIN_2v1767735 [Rhizophagus irregularis DAOM 181602=DAOM 197198]|uniref:Uncharacterized protein n=1 Tax=Rhizophagus irregularis (strain DAOM 181602 / DAOM 197198 / MUCL 43194) TaxID=747089 RepID=A0A2P4QIG1_RHIID|nr:hypothetical protein GLOIN_2v1767735 [Rhizophagus irregularis DAOM 181602=DAOM 197198]POG77431.1 hypothetical protein GLOIN_2v1767735 [Rhizophagus irregularis DAOM 181602=DAOM 197198]GET51013.1 hypothetical protein GLOIN_2v1767735 [Rhizophagus irregularis DAOM 181602=DAOM 197198]|eukprot:XP_025184297.1 hypothetical protein GLOIN_2v1767735 [Rhizophagus irregularis DAOM 181602=DAOM 197198]
MEKLNFLIEDSYENKVELLNIYNYDDHVFKAFERLENISEENYLNNFKNIHDIVIKRFGNLKDAEYQMMIDLLNNSISLTLDIYAVLFRTKIIDAKRNNNSFENFFINLRNPVKSQIKELKSLEKKFSLFLFLIFDKIYQNIENTKQINNNNLNKRLSTSLEENETPLFENENKNDEENDDNENIENILEKTECDVENQYNIIYQQWLNYN